MVNRLVSFAAAASAAVMVTATCVANAQDAPAASNPAMDRGHRDGAAWRDMMQARRTARVQALRAVLQLRPDQEGAFQTFAQSMMSEHHEGWRHEAEPAAAMTTPQRLDMHLSHMDEREARLRQRVAATKQFYATLTPQQQKAFDGLMALRERHHGFGGGRHGEGAAG